MGVELQNWGQAQSRGLHVDPVGSSKEAMSDRAERATVNSSEVV